MNHYYTSDGKRVSKATIDRKIREAKAQKLEQMRDEYNFIFCESCGLSAGVRLDCSHTLSVDQCQKTGYTELAYDVTNIRILCRDCHKEHDKLN